MFIKVSVQFNVTGVGGRQGHRRKSLASPSPNWLLSTGISYCAVLHLPLPSSFPLLLLLPLPLILSESLVTALGLISCT